MINMSSTRKIQEIAFRELDKLGYQYMEDGKKAVIVGKITPRLRQFVSLIGTIDSFNSRTLLLKLDKEFN